MKLTIGGKTYTALTNLKFDPAADVTGSEVPINEFSVDVKTENDIDAMQYAWLYDDVDKLWAKYWVVYADRMDSETVTVKAQSSMKLLERNMLQPRMYSAEPVADVVAEIFETTFGAETAADYYILDSAFENETVTGFVPEQSCKTRLQWVCFILGAYIKSFFSEKIEIHPVGGAPKLIPEWCTKYKPPLNYGEYRTRIAVTAYSFEERTPETTDSWVDADGHVYVQSKRNHGLRNPDAPAGALTHETHIGDVTLVNDDNVDDILTRVGPYYFKRMTADVDVINNGDYLPGELVYFYTAEDQIAMGYIEKADFSFGTQACSRLKMTPVEIVDADNLTVICKYNNTVLARFRYLYPVGYPYDMELPVLDQMWGITRYIFVPEESTIEGVVEDGGTEVEVDYALAVGVYQGTALVLSVDEYTVEDGTVKIL